MQSLQQPGAATARRRTRNKGGRTSTCSDSSYSRYGMLAASRAALAFLQYGQPTVVITATRGSCSAPTMDCTGSSSQLGSLKHQLSILTGSFSGTSKERCVSMQW